MTDFDRYQSPLSWRYASPRMREVWSETHKRRLWRRIWLALAEEQAAFGLVSPDQVEELQATVNRVDVARSLAIEAEIHHDLMAELQSYAEQCPSAGGILHLGATAMDIKDNAEALQVRSALQILEEGLLSLMGRLATVIDHWAETPIIAFTHLQPAEPSTLGYRLAQFGQDLLADWQGLSQARAAVRGKGMKGAVGTAASFAELVGVDQVESFEARVMARLALAYYPVATQTYPRKQDFLILSLLASLGATLYKFSFDLRILQSPPIGEWSEPFRNRQVGSSAMPFKRNPIQAEKIDSLARYLAQLPRVAWDNAAHSLLERTLDDSANRRLLIPEAFLIADELVGSTRQILEGLRVDESAMARNLEIYSPFAATERLLMALVKAGGDRQEMHARLRDHSLAAWQAVQLGHANPLLQAVVGDPVFGKLLGEESIFSLFDASNYVGNAPQRARKLAERIRQVVGVSQGPPPDSAPGVEE